MERPSEAAGARLTAVTETMAGEVDAMLGRASEAMDGARAGMAAQGDAMLAMPGAHQAALDEVREQLALAEAQNGLLRQQTQALSESHASSRAASMFPA